MEDELYDVIIQNIKQKLIDKVRGEVSVSKDNRNIYVSIYRFGYHWHSMIANVDLMSPDSLNSDDFVMDILAWYRSFVNESYFR